MPILRFSGGTFTRSFLLNTVLPLTVIFPISGFKNPQSARMAVVFPQPDGPTIPTISPGSTVREKSFKTVWLP